MRTLFERATTEDTDVLLGMMRQFYAIDSYPVDETAARAALQALIADSSLGGVWLIHIDGQIAGYVVFTLGFSLEFHGRDAFVDELFVVPEFRSRGIGAEALSFIEQQCTVLGVHALHLEVEKSNTVAQHLYRERGFSDSNRFLMTKWIENDMPRSVPSQLAE